MYAIVDIETTGSHPFANGITEIAIVLHNGTEVEGRFETLINPGIPIPGYITYLTGISNRMLADAPSFEEMAMNIYRLLNGRIFIAHNVNFDYTFLKHHLQAYGLEWKPKKLCTLKLSRKVFPGHHRYGLGHICKTLEIPVQNRHRAAGDANATAILFEKILSEGGDKVIKDFLRKDNHEQILPPNLPREDVNNLPYSPGVYYFYDAKGKIIYVGKAKSLRKRVLNHFTGLNTGKRRQDFLRNIYKVSFAECPTELTAFILESVEIKKHWPVYNYSQKRFDQMYGIYSFQDAKGYQRLAIDKKRKNVETVAQFHLLNDAYRTMWQMVREYELNPHLCFLDKSITPTPEFPDVSQYNERVKNAVTKIQKVDGTYFIFEESVFGKKQSCILIENGKFYGMGLLPENLKASEPEKIKPHLTCYPENEVIPVLLKSFVRKNPDKVIMF
ncbi:MAG: exonuclease domain-containing protein [Parafilimonas sp.]